MSVFHSDASRGEALRNLFCGVGKRINMPWFGKASQQPVGQIEVTATRRFDDTEQIQFITRHAAVTGRADGDLARRRRRHQSEQRLKSHSDFRSSRTETFPERLIDIRAAQPDHRHLPR